MKGNKIIVKNACKIKPGFLYSIDSKGNLIESPIDSTIHEKALQLGQLHSHKGKTKRKAAHATNLAAKKIKNTKSVNVKENTATPTLPTTPYYIKSWGYYNKNKKIIIEQINPAFFIYNIDGKKGLVEVQHMQITKNFTIPYLEMEGMRFQFQGKLYPAFQFYNTPSIKKCEDYINGKLIPRTYDKIHEDIEKSLKEMFDFGNDIDIKTSAIAIGQSWIKPELNNSFFYGIDASKGGGKTTLGEIVYFLMRHGFIGGNISSAALVRLASELDLNIFVDEIDQAQKDEDIMAALRKGQRRGNPYVRCEGRDNHPVVYDLFGCHGFSYRSEVEDAFMDRSLRVHTAKSNNSMLPVINTYKQDVLKHLADELFFWFIENIHVVGSSKEKGCSRVFNTYNINRENIYNVLTSDLNTEEKTYLKEVFGRNNELTYLCLQTCRVLGLNMLDSIKKIIQNKKDDAASSENFYQDELKEFMHLLWNDQNNKTLCSKKLKDGENVGCYFYPKNRLYGHFAKHLKEMNQIIGSKKFTSILREFGFIEGISIKSQRFNGPPAPCLIFTPDILINLNLEIDKIQEQFE